MVRFGDLSIGTAFVYMGMKFVKTSDRRTLCYDLSTGAFITDIYEFTAGDRVCDI